MNEQPQVEKKKNYKSLVIFLLVSVFISCVLAYFRPAIIEWATSGYEPLDYDSVMLNPGLFKDEACSLDGEIVQIIGVDPNSNTKLSFFRVREHSDRDHVWFVYGEVSPADFQKMQEGMDISIKGSCIGTYDMTTVAGLKKTLPAIRFFSYDYGYKFPSEATP